MPSYYAFFEPNGFVFEWGKCCGNIRAEEKPDEKLEKAFKALKNKLEEDGFLSVGYICSIMGFDSDNPYGFYYGDKESWKKALIEKLYTTGTDDPEVTKQIIEVLHEEYEEED